MDRKIYKKLLDWKIDKQHKDLHAIRFSMLPYKEQEYLTNLPLYLAFNIFYDQASA